MLNRRSLRNKTMQGIYAFRLAERSCYNESKNKIKEYFKPEIFGSEPQDVDLLNEQCNQAIKSFEQNYKDQNYHGGQSDILRETIKNYHQSVKKEQNAIANQLLDFSKKSYKCYLLVLRLIIELGLRNKIEKEDRTLLVKDPRKYKLADNKIIKALQESEQLQKHLSSEQINWSGNEQLIKQLHSELKKDEVFKEYILQEDSFENDKAIIIHLIKNFIVNKANFIRIKEILEDEKRFISIEEEEKNIPLMYAFFEEIDMMWEEDRDTIKDMVLKSIKNIKHEGDPIELVPISKNWKEDSSFFIDLYHKTISQQDELEKIIYPKIKNWESERVAWVDNIILQMAVCELLYFYSIPVKVSINEYIEMAKIYSTPKSKTFINGILDTIAKQLKEEGRIQKSGLGLIDNK